MISNWFRLLTDGAARLEMHPVSEPVISQQVNTPKVASNHRRRSNANHKLEVIKPASASLILGGYQGSQSVCCLPVNVKLPEHMAVSFLLVCEQAKRSRDGRTDGGAERGRDWWRGGSFLAPASTCCSREPGTAATRGIMHGFDKYYMEPRGLNEA